MLNKFKTCTTHVACALSLEKFQSPFIYLVDKQKHIFFILTSFTNLKRFLISFWQL